MSNIGIYIHIPFCAGKCPYCDFYSLPLSADTADRYTDAICREIDRYAGKGIVCGTVYFGGGTPSLMGAPRIERILSHIKHSFTLTPDCEITLEANPCTVTPDIANGFAGAGINRISMGVQSGIDSELAALGRKHDSARAAQAVKYIRAAGIDNISLDLMIATPGQTPDSLRRSVDFLASLEPKHISSYLLKIEKGTRYADISETLCLPDEDMQSRLYLESAEHLERYGYKQYEISNFSLPGYESRHNLKYWNCEEYIGFGPSAHGYFEKRRYFYPRDLMQYIEAPQRQDDGEGGSREEYAMLRLRLTEGITDTLWRGRFGEPLPKEYIERAKKYQPHGLTECTDSSVKLTCEGFLVSNALISGILY